MMLIMCTFYEGRVLALAEVMVYWHMAFLVPDNLVGLGEVLWSRYRG